MNRNSIFEASTYNAWDDVPLTYLICEMHRAFPADYQEEMVVGMGTSASAVRLRSGHSPFLSMPTVVVDPIRGAKTAEQGASFANEGYPADMNRLSK